MFICPSLWMWIEPAYRRRSRSARRRGRPRKLPSDPGLFDFRIISADAPGIRGLFDEPAEDEREA
jgi:hypothetical protein